MTNSPLSRDRIDRRNVYCSDRSSRGRAWRSRGAQDAHSARGGRRRVARRGGAGGANDCLVRTDRPSAEMLLSRDNLAGSGPDTSATLTARGRARLTVLELCDGSHPLAEVERGLYERHPDLFATPDEAAVFASEVVTRSRAEPCFIESSIPCWPATGRCRSCRRRGEPCAPR